VTASLCLICRDGYHSIVRPVAGRRTHAVTNGGSGSEPKAPPGARPPRSSAASSSSVLSSPRTIAVLTARPATRRRASTRNLSPRHRRPCFASRSRTARSWYWRGNFSGPDRSYQERSPEFFCGGHAAPNRFSTKWKSHRGTHSRRAIRPLT